jgi:hypothetical protein
MKVRNSPKAKLDSPAEMPVQLALENAEEEHVVISVDSGNSNTFRERRKEDASKPLYLKRV